MTNMFKMLKDAVAAQKNLKKIQQDLKLQTIEFSSPGKKVRVVACGDASIASIKISPDIIKPDRADELEKEITGAINGALEAAKKASAEHMKNVMADMGLPDIPGL